MSGYAPVNVHCGRIKIRHNLLSLFIYVPLKNTLGVEAQSGRKAFGDSFAGQARPATFADGSGP